ncbi:MAG TPA: cadherin-like domain-containing protein [Candidatus Faecousia faecavium]|nr:cadherin-like domain-containing protein [Candidatus Faecousia faecavium]
MFQTRFASLFLAVCCAFGLIGSVSAAEVDSGSVYCFSAGDFSGENTVVGICLTEVPQKEGTIQLGSRILRPGDILTAEQVSQMTFTPVNTESDQSVQVSYLPIYEDYVAESTTMTIAIRGKEDKAPVAEDMALETYKNLENTGKLKVSDPEGQSLTFTVTRQPKRGTVTIAEDGTFTYTPKKNKVGVDSFTYTATDPAGKVSREATVTITILKPTDATQYTDTLGKECRFAAEWMRHTGIFVGESLAETPCFSPEREVTRGEFVTMLVKALDIPTDEELTDTGYTDEIPQWLQPYLAAAQRAGLTAGLPNQEAFGAGEVITGAEVSVMLQNALDLTMQQEAAVTQDEAVPAWAQSAVTVTNDAGFALEAGAPLTRGTAAQVLYQASKMVSSN